MKVTIIMTYYNREDLILKTLSSLEKSSLKEFNVVIVDDASEKELQLPKYSFLVDVVRIPKSFKTWKTHTPAQNIGIRESLMYNPDIVILQNAEAIHIGDVISYAYNNVTQENYISFSCYSASQKTSLLPNIELNIHEVIASNNTCAIDSDHDSWYNHPLYRGTGYDFCSAITIENLLKLNGYDERYKDGYCYSDDDFVMRIKRLGLKIEIPVNPFVVHQWHGSSGNVENFSELTVMNRDLYCKIVNEETGYRAKHIITEDL